MNIVPGDKVTYVGLGVVNQETLIADKYFGRNYDYIVDATKWDDTQKIRIVGTDEFHPAEFFKLWVPEDDVKRNHELEERRNNRVTLRDQFAMAALPCMSSVIKTDGSLCFDEVAKLSYAMADEMLRARKPK